MAAFLIIAGFALFATVALCRAGSNADDWADDVIPPNEPERPDIIAKVRRQQRYAESRNRHLIVGQQERPRRTVSDVEWFAACWGVEMEGGEA